MTKNTETTAPAAPAAEEKPKNVQVSTSLPADTFAALDEYRWEKRVSNMSGMLRLAVDEFVERHGLKALPTTAK